MDSDQTEQFASFAYMIGALVGVKWTTSLDLLRSSARGIHSDHERSVSQLLANCFPLGSAEERHLPVYFSRYDGVAFREKGVSVKIHTLHLDPLRATISLRGIHGTSAPLSFDLVHSPDGVPKLESSCDFDISEPLLEMHHDLFCLLVQHANNDGLEVVNPAFKRALAKLPAYA